MLRLHHLPPFSVTSAHYYGKNGGLFFTALQSLAEMEFNHTLLACTSDFSKLATEF